MKIIVLHYYKSIVDGVMTSLIDAYFNMKDNPSHDVELKIFCPELFSLDHDDYYNFPLEDTQNHRYINKRGIETIPYENSLYPLVDRIMFSTNQITTSIPFLRFNRNFGDFNLYYSIEMNQKKYEADMIVCSARLIYEILIGESDIELKCKKLVVLDSLDTYRSKIGEFPDFDDYFDTLSNTKILQLSNPATFRDSKYEQKEYYHKFSERRLSALEQSNILKNEYTFKRAKDKTNIYEDSYFENIGKGIFEHLYLGKTVHYKTDGMFTKDGLYYYLRLFNIDVERNQTIEITKEEIKDKLFFKEDDNEII